MKKRGIIEIIFFAFFVLINLTFVLAVPNITFVNSTFISNTSILINVSSVDNTGDHFVVNDWNDSFIMWLDYDNVSGINPVDISNHGNNATGWGDVSQIDSGKWGKAFNSLNGSGGARVINGNTTFNFSRDITLSIWMKDNQQDYSSSSYPPIMARVGYHTGLAISGPNEKVYAGSYNSSNLGSMIYEQTAHTKGEWYHYVFRKEDNNISLWKDGILQGSYIHYGDIKDAIYFGAPDYSFNGSVDEAMIFNRSLSDYEIQSLYNATAYQYYNHFGGLENGTYTYRAYTKNVDGNMNSTESRIFSVQDTNNNYYLTTNNGLFNITYRITPQFYAYGNLKAQQLGTSIFNGIYANVSYNDTNSHANYLFRPSTGGLTLFLNNTYYYALNSSLGITPSWNVTYHDDNQVKVFYNFTDSNGFSSSYNVTYAINNQSLDVSIEGYDINGSEINWGNTGGEQNDTAIPVFEYGTSGYAQTKGYFNIFRKNN